MQVVQFLDSLNGFRNFDHLLFKKNGLHYLLNHYYLGFFARKDLTLNAPLH